MMETALITKTLPLLLTLALFGCKDDAADDSTTDDSTADDSSADDSGVQSLYDQLGGQAGVEAVVTELISVIAADGRINWMFANSDLDALSTKLQEQICAATGGGCTYTGGDMATVHAGMAITDAQFDALVEDLLTALTTLGVPYSPDFNGEHPADLLIQALGGLRGEVVTDAAGTGVYFNALGGHAAVQAVIDGLLANVSADSRINAFFMGTDVANLNRLLVEQVCEATGGYCVYSGRSMADAHSGLCISASDFSALVEDLLMALDDLGVPYTPNTYDQHLGADDLILALAGMQGDIVETCNQ